MNELFHEDGHLTDYALNALICDGPLDELSRLEISEHLSFCDECIDRYTVLLAKPLLLTPPESVAPGALKRLKERARRLFRSRYTTAIAAASFAIVFWNIGLFNIDLSNVQNSKMLNALGQSAVSFSEKTSALADSISKAVDDFYNVLLNPGRGRERLTSDHSRES